MMSILKRLFGIGRAKRESVDEKIDFDIIDLKKGFIFDYDLRSWEVEDVVIYTWDNGVEDFEYNIFDGKEKLYLSYETVGGRISIYSEGNMNEIWPMAGKKMHKDEDLSDSEFVYMGDMYYYSGEGSARVKSSQETFHMQNWLFQSDANDALISFNKYEDNSKEAYVGKKLKGHEITNILPR